MVYSGKRAVVISIHALMKRATVILTYRPSGVNHFNPRPHEEGDASGITLLSADDHFNPRPHEEGDLPLKVHPILIT